MIVTILGVLSVLSGLVAVVLGLLQACLPVYGASQSATNNGLLWAALGAISVIVSTILLAIY